MRVIDLTGQRFGHLVVTGRAENTPAGQARWACLCDCGVEVIRAGQSLREGHSAACTRRGKHRECSRPGCSSIAHKARGLCGMHYQWWLRSNKAPTLTEGVFAVPVSPTIDGLYEWAGLGGSKLRYWRNRHQREALRSGIRLASEVFAESDKPGED